MSHFYFSRLMASRLVTLVVDAAAMGCSSVPWIWTLDMCIPWHSRHPSYTDLVVSFIPAYTTTPLFIHDIVSASQPVDTTKGTIHNNLSENFLKSCEEVIHTLTFDSPVLPISTTYQVAQLKFDEDDEAYISDAKRLSTFYANVAYDFYGAPSGALCVYKNGDA
nr:hypothetical protein L203_04383 [Cryptococcus depauperatus CBS 7841]